MWKVVLTFWPDYPSTTLDSDSGLQGMRLVLYLLIVWLPEIGVWKDVSVWWYRQLTVHYTAAAWLLYVTAAIVQVWGKNYRCACMNIINTYL